MRPLCRCLLAALAALGPAYALHACTRHADVREEVLSQTFDPSPDLDADILPLDADLSSDAHVTCADRPTGEDCVGSNDFLCAFSEWALGVAKQCQIDTGCRANGSIAITMGPDGCVSALGMDEPSADLVACVAAEVSAVKCPCTDEETIVHYFGVGNDGVCPEN